MSDFKKLGTSTDFADGSITGAKLADGSIANVDVSATAAIALSKLAATTVSKALASDSGGLIVASSVTATELGYLSGVTSALQTQIAAKAPSASPTFTGSVTTPLSANKAVATGSAGVLAASATTDTELGYVSGVTSAIQTQLTNSLQVFKVSGVDGTATGATTIGTTASNGRQFYPFYLISEVTAAATLSVAASVSFGTNSTAFDNLLAISALTGLTALNKTLVFTPLTAALVSVAPGTAMKVKVTTGAVAGTCTMQFSIAGIYA